MAEILKRPRKFYKRTGIALCENKDEDGGRSYEVMLDKYRLRTPNGTVVRVPTEPLALAIAKEWDSQEDRIRRASMHLTSLANTVLDNPMHLTREDIIRSLLEFGDSDTLCYRCSEPEALAELETARWDPVLKDICSLYDLQINVYRDFTMAAPSSPILAERDREKLRRELLGSFDRWSLVGLQHMTKALSSLFLSLSIADSCLNVDEAVELSRLEQNFQTERWGELPYVHELQREDLRANVAAGALMVLLVRNHKRTCVRMDR